MARSAVFPASGVLVFALAGLQVIDAGETSAPRRPNIIVILADDLGYADLGCQGMKDIPTPHIDSLAKDGIRCTSAYVSCPVCSPTRAGLMTGRYQQRFGHEFNPGPLRRRDSKFGLPLGEKTLADRLKALGYVTGLVGKWHLGNDADHHPLRRGFDSSFGFLGGAHSYLDPKANPADLILRGTEPVDEKEYLTDAFTREASAFIEKNRGKPFFLYLAYNAVHGPMHPSRDRIGRFGAIADEKRRTYASMMAALDDGVGAVLGKLREAGLEDDALVFFLTDNGGPTRVNTSRNDPLRGFKGQVWEGGIRVPFLVRWKARLPGGKVYGEPVSSLDIVPTALAAAGAPPGADSGLDGVDLAPHLAGKADRPPHESLLWRFGAQAAIRQGKWKLVRIGDAAPQLFDLEADIGEAKDLAASRPDETGKLRAALEKWTAGLAEPLWGPAAQAAAGDKAAKKAGAKAAGKKAGARKKARAKAEAREF
jgi:arylsulfatase A-like enzyme